MHTFFPDFTMPDFINTPHSKGVTIKGKQRKRKKRSEEDINININRNRITDDKYLWPLPSFTNISVSSGT